MFKGLTDNLNNVFKTLTSRGVISNEDLDISLREIRIALLTADVSLEVVVEFIENVRKSALGQEVVKSIKPGQLIVKIVQDELTRILGFKNEGLKISSPPCYYMIVGLQGSGKTTSSAKIAKKLASVKNIKILLVSLDVNRPAAQEQLAILAVSANIDSLSIIKGETPVEIAKRAQKEALKLGYDLVIFDTAGRLHVDNELMDELVTIEKLVNPTETILVLDSMTGQDAVNVAKSFKEKLNLTSCMLTRVDGDNRGGAALSLRTITNCPIKLTGTGEKLTDLEEFYPERVAARILDMGDIVSLAEKAIDNFNEEEAEKLAKKIQKGKFDLNDMLSQLNGISKMGGVSSLLNMLPGVSGIRDKIENANIDKNIIAKQKAIIQSMTKEERKNYKIILASRKVRIAKGSGVRVQDVNQLLKQFQQMSDMLKKLNNMDQKKLQRSGLAKLFS